MYRPLYLPRLAGALVALTLVTGAAASCATDALAATSGGTVTCPTVDPTTGDLTPNWANGVDWAGCNLTGANLYEAELFDADLAGAKLTDANLQGADVSGADMTGAMFDDGIDVDGTILAGATFTDARTGGLIGTPASIPADWALVNGYLAGPGADLEYANLLDQDLTGVDLTGANLSTAGLRGSTLTNAALAGADLSPRAVSRARRPRYRRTGS